MYRPPVSSLRYLPPTESWKLPEPEDEEAGDQGDTGRGWWPPALELETNLREV